MHMAASPINARRPKTRSRAKGQVALALPFTHGGRRKGAGRKPKGKMAMVTHRARPEVSSRHPVHVTLRLGPGVGSLRGARAYRAVTQVLLETRARFGVRITVQSTQKNHLHLIVEAPDRKTLARAMQGLTIRLAKRLNRLWARSGKVFADRYHARVLGTPLEVRRALAYVLNNARRHAATGGRRLPDEWVDPCSSGLQFDGWQHRPLQTDIGPPTVVSPKSWLLRTGWRRHGLIAISEVPGPDAAA